MAKIYHVDDNPMFLALADQLTLQQSVIKKIKSAVNDKSNLMTTKEYVKGRKNTYVNPLIKELPKQADMANKTIAQMLVIIKELGKEEKPVTKLGEFINDE